jgi:hypothetical protein
VQICARHIPAAGRLSIVFTSSDKHRFPNGPEPANSDDALHSETSFLQTLSHGALREEADVTAIRAEMGFEIESDNEQILDPAVIGSSNQKQPVFREDTTEFTDCSLDVKEMLDYF